MRAWLLVGGLTCSAWASAVDVYVMSSEDLAVDSAVSNALTAQGHNPILGAPYHMFDGTADLTGIEAVYFQSNANWANPDMPLAGQVQLARFVAGGGGLVMSEWCTWRMANSAFQRIARMTPFVITSTFSSSWEGAFQLVTTDPVVSAGVPSYFYVLLNSYAGTTSTVYGVRPGGTQFYSFYDGWDTTVGLAGRPYGRGRVASFSTTNGPDQFGSASFPRLFGNTIQWVSNGAGGVSVSGHVDLQDWLASPGGVEVELAFWQGGDSVYEAPFVALDASGNFDIPVPLSGTYDVTVKGSHWLRRLHASSVDIGVGGASGLNFSLINGDVDDSNMVDSDDFDRLVAGFGYTLGDGGYDPATDLNGTDNTDSDDFDILVANFGLGGD